MQILLTGLTKSTEHPGRGPRQRPLVWIIPGGSNVVPVIVLWLDYD